MDDPNVELISQGLWGAVQFVRILAWPIVFALLAWWYRDALRKLVESLSRRRVNVKAPGFDVTAEAVKEQQSENVPGTTNSLTAPPSPPVPMAAPSNAVAKLEAEIEETLQRFPGNEHVQRLLRALAESNLRAGHESVYRRIFGSQILALQRLDQRGGTATIADAKAFYDSLAPLWPEMYPSYSFDSWLGFVLSTRLVERDGGNLKITAYGHDFLLFLTANRLAPDKPF